MNTSKTPETGTLGVVPAVEVRGLIKHYGSKTAVDGVDLTVGQHETVAILGANGAGKTTTVEAIAGLRSPDAGHVRVLGLDPRKDRAKVRQVLGVQLQEAQLHTSLTVTELIELYRSFYPNPRSTEELLELVELQDKRTTRFENLSGGQQQRVSVALAFTGRPQVLILDELTTGLDPAARRRMWNTIEHLQALGTTILLVSHAMDEVQQLSDRVILLDAGRILIEGTATEIVEKTGTTTLDDAFVALTGHELEVTS